MRQNLASTHNLTDAAAVMRFRELVRSQAKAVSAEGKKRSGAAKNRIMQSGMLKTRDSAPSGRLRHFADEVIK